jgi:hypothetical protein
LEDPYTVSSRAERKTENNQTKNQKHNENKNQPNTKNTNGTMKVALASTVGDNDLCIIR